MAKQKQKPQNIFDIPATNPEEDEYDLVGDKLFPVKYKAPELAAMQKFVKKINREYTDKDGRPFKVGLATVLRGLGWLFARLKRDVQIDILTKHVPGQSPFNVTVPKKKKTGGIDDILD